MIEYIEVRSKNDREIIGIIDGAKSVIWHSVYYGVGDFEIYAQATQKHLEMLVEGNYITRPNDIEVGIIENIEISNNSQDGIMIVASGRFVKSILDRRHIYNLSGKTNTPTILRGNVEVAVRTVVSNNAINCSFDNKRNIPILQLGTLSNIPAVIVDGNGQATQKQVSYENLLEYTDSVLKEYQLASIITLNDDTNKLEYTVFEGIDRSTSNEAGNEPVIFSAEFDNLTESNYTLNSAMKKTTALIGGEGEGLERFYSLVAGNETGFDRRETWVDASSISKTYKDGQNVERTYTDEEYSALLNAQGKQDLATLITTEAFNGSLNVTGGIWRLNEDYMLGDIVTIQDNNIGKYANVRITEITEAQDENGYSVDVTYSSD